MRYIESPTTYDFPVIWNGSNAEEVMAVVAEWGAAVFKDNQFSQYVSVSPNTTEDNLFLVHPGATMLAIITKGERVRLSYKKGKPYGITPVTSISDEEFAASYEEETP